MSLLGIILLYKLLNQFFGRGSMNRKVLYHPRLNILGFTFGLDNVIKIAEDNQYMVITGEWVEIGSL